MFKKKLRNLLTELDCNVKIKCQTGSSFIYCGKPNIRELEKVERKYIEYIEDQIERTQKQRMKIKYKSLLTHRVAFLDRPIVDIYDGILSEEAPCKIIVISGRENGKYWTVKEYEKNGRK